jgi:hypothetical protein
MNKTKIELTDSKVKDITFFEEDISELTGQLTMNESLYKDFFRVYKELTGGKYLNIKSPRDIAEVAKALVQLRSLCTDTAFKRHQVRKNLSDIVHRSGDVNEDKDEMIKETARVIINEVRNIERLNPTPKIKDNGGASSEKEKQELDNKIQKYISEGDIKLSTNDKLIGVNDYIEYKYDKKNSKFIAIDNRSGNPIPNFPKERLPNVKITRMSRNEVVANTGDSYETIGD